MRTAPRELLDGLVARAVNATWVLAARPAERRFRTALSEPERAQGRRLRALVRAGAPTAYGRAHGLGAVQSVEAFQRALPLTRAEDYAEAIEAIRRGEASVLTGDPVRRLVPSGGSTGPVKLIPYTATVQREMNEAIGAWIVDLVRADPALGAGPAYWSVSPAIDLPARTSQVPIGFDDDARYLGRGLGRLVRRALVAPGALRRVRPLASFQYATLLFMLAEPELRLISVWHPSFLSVLWETRAAHWDRLVEDVAAGSFRPPHPVDAALTDRLAACRRANPRRARWLAALGPTAAADAVWPELRLVSAWADGAAAPAFTDLAARMPGVRFQPKGLLSTEAFVTIPYQGHWPLAVTAHFYEFLDDAGRAWTAERLVAGAEYEVVVTTGGGLYRYRTGDRVRVESFLAGTPTLRFLGRVDQVVDLTGEKLDEAWVGALIEQIGRERETGFAMLAPDAQGARRAYTLYTDVEPPAAASLAAALGERLRENPGFAYAQDLGQLGPLRAFSIAEPAHAAYLRRLAGRGTVLGAIKPARLSPLDGWSEHFRGRYAARSVPEREPA